MRNIALICISTFALSGCTSLDAVRKISSDLTSASATWKQAGNELHASCKRRYAINDDIANCDASEASSKGLGAATDVLRTYFSTLGAISNEGDFSIDEGLENLSGAAKDIEGVNAEQVDAVTGLAKALIKIRNEARRERLIRTLIDENGDKVHTIIDSLLKDHVVEILKAQLQTERVSLALFFDSKFEQARLPSGVNPRTYCEDRLPSDRPSLQFLLVRDFCSQDAELQEKERALVAYRKSLEKASEAMRDLQSNKAKLTGKGLARQLYAIGDELNASVEDVRSAFD